MITRAMHGPKFLGPARCLSGWAQPCFILKFSAPARLRPILDEVGTQSGPAIPLSVLAAYPICIKRMSLLKMCCLFIQIRTGIRWPTYAQP